MPGQASFSRVVVVPRPIDDAGRVVRTCVDGIQGASVLEMRPDGALIVRRTGLIARSEALTLKFSKIDEATTKIELATRRRMGMRAPDDVPSELERKLMSALTEAK
ncbi:hypothetical protein [Curtobacterium luteum]|uniref:hypothetical protein n=1 Tax=Curtobacterium luteum TaxID=33881 RepID=UPI003812D327